MSLKESELDLNAKFKIFLNSRTKAELKDIIRDYNDYCVKNDKKEYKIRGYSKYKKYELADFIIDSLPAEEKERIFKNIQQETLDKLFNDGLNLYLGKDKRENFENKEEIDGLEVGYKYKFKGFSWDGEIDILITDDNKIDDFRCTCRTGQAGGFCMHFFAGIIDLIKSDVLDPESLGVFFDLSDSQIEKLQEKKTKEIAKETIPKINTAPVIQEVSLQNEDGKVYIYDAKITEITETVSKYREHVSKVYILTVNGGKCAPGEGESIEKRSFDKINARASKNTMDKYNLKVGDIIKFKGKFKNHPKYGLVIQNIRKFTKV
ncbi:MAG: hypothetical protein GF329_18400 [Candidatus Lokiarchaeota archaeon]|nr:hypothetical protein [Candidatus Lokiarchaeota archaeon]